jgi:hypothetical protein
MKDRNDSDTRSLILDDGAERQARYRSNQLRLGRRQRSFWLTDDEAKEVKDLLAELRSRDSN